MFLSTLFWSKQDMISVIDYLTFEAVRGFVDQLDSFGIFIEVLVHGNLTPDDALNVSGILEKSFSNSRTLLKSQLIRDREIQLSPNSNYYHTVTTDVHKSSCIEVCIQCGVEDPR
jgi:insulysin